jgi:predicted DsbA family dithiol-disulfide isomerase
MNRPAAVVAQCMQLEIWSDVVCPWCYIGKRHFEAALADFPHRDDVEVVWRSFELDPSAPASREGDYVGRLATKYGVPADQAQAMIDRMTATAAGVGLDFHFETARPGNTFDAHRLLHLAHERGVQDALKERFFAATFTEGEPIADREALVRLAVSVGLDEHEVRAALESDAYADAVRADEARARSYGISGVPFFVVDQTYGVSGAQPPAMLLEVLEKAWAETHAPALVVTGGDRDGGAACEGDDCII